MKSPRPVRRFFAKRARAELPVVLDRKRIFILPTKFGLLFALLLLALLIGSINYTNNLGFFLTFLLASTGFVSIFHTYVNLRGLEVSRIETGETFAGDRCLVNVHCRTTSRPFRDIRISLAGATPAASGVNLEPGTGRSVRASGKKTQRGVRPLPGIVIHTTYPLGLFRAWSNVSVAGTFAVFPHPSEAVSLVSRDIPGDSSRDDGSGRRPGSDDFGGLREYVPGDPMQRVAWKSSSKGTGLLTKEFVTGTRRHVGIRWDDVQGSDEERLSQLCAMILAAEKRGAPYWLELPGHVSDVARGVEHRHRCLMRLAAYGTGAGTEGEA
ncbi:DUF58 domain-containing protein [Desulfoplanes sp.]